MRAVTEVLPAVLSAASVVLLALRWGAWRWLAVAAAVPTLVVGLGEPGIAFPASLLVSSFGLLLGAWRWPADRALLGSAGLFVVLGGGLVTVWGPDDHQAVHDAWQWAALGPCLALVLAAAAGAGRARRAPQRWVGAVIAVVALTILAVTGTTDLLAAWLPAAAALAVTALLRGGRGRA
ncbi:MAG: hypothetical protein QM638_10500, partial [Nocardioides sp.]|uniref:hypothetical protein n=1 Tax=Nocardioides sp. TaxID=35761 RepID=UPI0039E6CF6B